MHDTIPYSAKLLHDWQAIRNLDEEENWTERTQVVTKEDHELYTEAARVMNYIQEYFTVVIRCAKKKKGLM